MCCCERRSKATIKMYQTSQINRCRKGSSNHSPKPPLPKSTMRKETRTDMGETQSEKASRPENHFSRLPDELFLLILTIMADLKSLFQCSLVSKHFASAVFRVQNVCVTVLRIRPQSMESFQDLWMLPKPKQLVFLEQFRELESIYLEYKYIENIARSSFTKWKVKFGTNFPKFDRLLGVLPASAHEHTSNEPNLEQVNQQSSTETLNGRWKDGFRSSLVWYLEWLVVALMLVKRHNSLIRVIISDSEKEGKMVIGEEHLGRIRSFNEPVEIFQSFLGLEIDALRWLRLPFSGYGMRWVVLLNLNYTTEPYASSIDDIVSWNFDDEEKVLVEAIKEIYKNKGHEVKKINLF